MFRKCFLCLLKNTARKKKGSSRLYFDYSNSHCSRHCVKSTLAARASSVFLPSYRGTAFIAVFLTGCFLIECV